MIFADRFTLDPLAPPALIAVLFLIAAAAWGFYLWRGGGAPILRAAGVIFITIALLQPQWVREAREPAADVTLVLIDQSDSLALAGRSEAARNAGEDIAAALGEAEAIEVRVREARGGPDGTRIAGAIADALADLAPERVAGIVVVTDGQAADSPADPEALAQYGPIHTMIVGDPDRGDRRLELIAAPAFAIIDEPMRVTARVDDPAAGGRALVRVSIDGEQVSARTVTLGEQFTLQIEPAHRGRNMVMLEVDPGAQEITRSNNRAAFSVNAARDRLRVLLITGEPYAGARIWRNLLKSDPAVDLVHFTILRPLEKQDVTPLDELALIPFPDQELFERRLNEFDLIIFDRDSPRGVLQPFYYENIARRVRAGGALLMTAGGGETGAIGVYNSSLRNILPARPTGQTLTKPFRPHPTEIGARHPVLRGLPDPTSWGRWSRQVRAEARAGETLLAGADDQALLVLARAGEGRVAQLWSDQMWLWARGYDGGGPHGEMLRRLAHWLMQEPELEEERLNLEAVGQSLQITRSTLSAATDPVTLIAPSGAETTVTLSPDAPGLWRADQPADDQGLYEVRNGDLRAFAAIGPLNPLEAARVNADPDILRPLVEASGGGVFLLGEDGENVPAMRRVRAGARAHGEDWYGIEQNVSYIRRTAVAQPIGPAWAWAFAGLALLMLGWRREAR